MELSKVCWTLYANHPRANIIFVVIVFAVVLVILAVHNIFVVFLLLRSYPSSYPHKRDELQ
jgi:hypothetical protein